MTNRGAEPDTRMSVRVDDWDVVRLEWAPGVRIDEDLARTAMQAVDDINGGRERPLYVDMTGTAVLTREARQYFMRPCSASRIALVGRSPVDRVIANFSLGTMNLPAPMRFFTSEAAALTWLCDDRGVA